MNLIAFFDRTLKEIGWRLCSRSALETEESPPSVEPAFKTDVSVTSANDPKAGGPLRTVSVGTERSLVDKKLQGRYHNVQSN